MVQVLVPACNWCGRRTVEIYKCRSCRKFSCNDCHTGYDTSDRCYHRKYEPLSKDNWQINVRND